MRQMRTTHRTPSSRRRRTHTRRTNRRTATSRTRNLQPISRGNSRKQKTARTTKQPTMVTVTNIIEAQALAAQYPAIISAGPRRSETQWSHPNHYGRTFLDTLTGPYKPTQGDVEALLHFAAQQPGKLLVHCHKGESRSTAIAIGILIQRGATLEHATQQLQTAHKPARPFTPNLLILSHLEQVLGVAGIRARFDTTTIRTTRTW